MKNSTNTVAQAESFIDLFIKYLNKREYLNSKKIQKQESAATRKLLKILDAIIIIATLSVVCLAALYIKA